jgi:uncharacterized protein (DUF885 family)
VTKQRDAVSEADLAFTRLAREYLDDRAERHPDVATTLGDHRFDARLPDLSAGAQQAERAAMGRWAAKLGELGTAALSPDHQVDAAMLANSVKRRIFELDELDEDAWDPTISNPGRAINDLLARDFAPLPERLASVAGRLAGIPAMLAAARQRLGAMPRVHLETAIDQFAGTIGVVTHLIDAALAEAPDSSRQIEAVRPGAVEALTGHKDWLSARLEQAIADGDFADPRIGQELFASKLSLTLDAEADADAILTRAHADLDRISEEMSRLAAEITGTRGGQEAVRQVLDRLATQVPDERTILEFCRRALAAQTSFVADCRLVTNYGDPIEVIEMPEIDRGVAIAYCDAPGPLESAQVQTFIAVSPTPAGWPADRVKSFYREYNRHLVHDLMIHEAMPGHALQLQHSRRVGESATRLRAALRSGSFVEGWAVYAEEVMADHGYPGEGDPRDVRMQQLKMQLRMTINAILDARVQGHGMTEAEAMSLMTGRGHQEEGEAAGKWRRAMLTSGQLSTYYVGYTEVADLAAELRAAEPQRSLLEIHDSMLAHGSPPVRYLRTLVGARSPD